MHHYTICYTHCGHTVTHSVTQTVTHSVTQTVTHSVTQTVTHSVTQNVTHTVTHTHRQSLTSPINMSHQVHTKVMITLISDHHNTNTLTVYWPVDTTMVTGQHYATTRHQQIPEVLEDFSPLDTASLLHH